MQYMLISDIYDWAINMDYMGVNLTKPVKIMFGLSLNGKRSMELKENVKMVLHKQY